MLGIVMWVLGFIVFCFFIARDNGSDRDDNVGMFFVDRDNDNGGDEGGSDGIE